MIVYTLLYRLAISAYVAAIHVAALFNEKAKLFINGRKGLLQTIAAAMAQEMRPRIWMHCASLGEFEQGRPVLEALHEKYPQHAVVVTFFSPSGYEVRKNYSGADYVFYLPVDSPARSRAFLDAVQPALCLFVKYEFWYYYLSQIAERRIPAMLISAIFNKDQGFFKWYGGLQRSMLRCFTRIFVQDSNSRQLLEGINIQGVTVTGDTRFDRVVTAAENVAELPLATAFCGHRRILVAGSTWREDELFLHKALKLMPKDWKVILVPHEVDHEHVDDVCHLFAGAAVKWSECFDKSADLSVALEGKRVLVVDKVGLLMQLYKYSTVAWIGGGFGKEGVHNVLEAAVYGIPCFYGPVFHQFLEAKELIEKGGAFTVKEPDDLAGSLAELDDTLRYRQHGDAARRYVYAGAGATDKVLAAIAGYFAG